MRGDGMDSDVLMDMIRRANPNGMPPLDEESIAAYSAFADVVVRECADLAFSQWCDNGHEESARPTILGHFGLNR